MTVAELSASMDRNEWQAQCEATSARSQLFSLCPFESES